LIRPLLATAVVLTTLATAWSTMWLSARPDAAITPLPDVTQTVAVTTAVPAASTAVPRRASSSVTPPPARPATPTPTRSASGGSTASAATSAARPPGVVSPTAGSVTSSGSATVRGSQVTVHVTISAAAPLQVTVIARFTGTGAAQSLTLGSNIRLSGTRALSGTATLPAGANTWTYSIATPGRPVMTSAPAALH
jgi:hypothetical protein